MREMILIELNGFKEKVPSGLTIAELIKRFEEADTHLIAEHNGRFVYPKDYSSVIVKDGDRIEFINPSFGG
ncbi:MAG TPA: sulfur carrier protein ThiS [Desulfobacterales bacterium]|nr:sulfur carrier protein ThiS [Desulfobacterales bacterium]